MVTIATDSMEMYGSRLEEMNAAYGPLGEAEAAAAFERWFLGQTTSDMLELTWPERKRVHNLKYYTWVEQHGKTSREILAQWNDDAYWESLPELLPRIDALIEEFNERTGVKP